MPQLRVGPLVRAVSPDSIVIWTEWTHPCEATLRVTIDDQSLEQAANPQTARTQTVTVGNRHYALLRLDGLQPSTWYNYHVAYETDEGEQATILTSSALKQCFRTL